MLSIQAQESTPENSSPELPTVTAAISPFVENGDFAGIVSMVVSKDRVLHQSVLGHADIESGRPMRQDSIFWIASMSKPVTATAVLILVESGKLSLDDAITKHLPAMASLRDAAGQPVTITIRQLLSHTSGMAELDAAEAYTSKTLAEAADKYAKVKMLFPPGSEWKYSQTSINTAARIVEAVSGISFDEFVQTKICDPLRMVDTTFYLSEKQILRLATSYQKNDAGSLEPVAIRLLAGKSPTDRDRFPAGNGGLFSTAPDYAKFCQMLLGDGQREGTRLLTPESVATMKTIVTGDLKTGFTPGNGWGIGVCVVREPQGVSAALSSGSFGHGGAYGTQAWIDPTLGVAYILMIQQAGLPNADNSDLRLAFQKSAKETIAP